MKATLAVKYCTFRCPSCLKARCWCPAPWHCFLTTTGHTNNFHVQNVKPALADKLVVKFGDTTLLDTVGYDISKTFEDLFLPVEQRDNMVLEGIQNEELCKIRSKAGDK